MADSEVSASGTYETVRETQANDAATVKRWLDEIALADSTEKSWRKEASEVVNIYRSEKEGDSLRFNIVFSNTQTLASSLYNSTPTPDVRPRYSDPNEVSRLTSQTIERSLSYSLDAYDFDATMLAVVQDKVLPGRGSARVRYAPYQHKDPKTGETMVYDEVLCEHVLWKNRRQGHADRWADVPWIAYELFLTRDQLVQLNPKVGGGLNLDVTVDGIDQDRATVQPNVFKRARVWEIWDKATRKVLFVAPCYKAGPLRTEEDPLQLINFFPEPEPLYGLKTSGNLNPVCPYRIIRPLVEELEEITKRIQALIKVIKWRGYQHPGLPSFERLSEAEDGELVPATEELLSLVQAGGLEKFVWLMPIDVAIKAVQQLYVQREAIKQTIFEVSGLSDILRGQSDPDETLGAQEIKANFGSMRLQDQQKDVQRFCRDLMRLKAEIICTHFSPDNIAAMTGMALPSRQDVEQAKQRLTQLEKVQRMAAMAPQIGHNGGPPMNGGPQPNGMGGPPQIDPAEMEKLKTTAGSVAWDDVMDMLRSGVTRQYRIDIETDSTIRGEVRQQQQSAAAFLQGTAQYIEAMGPAVQTGLVEQDTAIDLFSSFARFFKLGKQAEDALQRSAAKAQEKARNPQPPPPSPEEIKAQAEQKKAEMDMQLAQKSHGLEMQAKQAELQSNQQTKQLEIGAKQKEIEMTLGAKEREMQLEARKADQEFQNDQVRMYAEFEAHQQQAAFDMQSAERKAALDEQTMARKSHHEERKAKVSEAMAVEKHKREMSKPQPRAGA